MFSQSRIGDQGQRGGQQQLPSLHPWSLSARPRTCAQVGAGVGSALPVCAPRPEAEARLQRHRVFQESPDAVTVSSILLPELAADSCVFSVVASQALSP